jgi:hypothetical protein
MNRNRFSKMLVGMSLVIGLVAANAGATVNVLDYGTISVHFYNEGDAYGSDTASKDFTALEKAATQRACVYLDSVIENEATRDVNIHLMWQTLGTGILGSSRTTRSGGRTGAEIVWRDGDLEGNSTTVDCFIRYSDVYNWYTGAAPAGIGSQYDLQSVITHEIVHSLGFSSTLNNTTDKFSTSLSTWDTLLEDSAGNVAESNGDGTPGDFNQEDNPVYWTGSIANDLFGNPVPIYAPASYTSGSSLSHVDEAEKNGGFDGLMNFSIGNSVVQREMHDVELAMMEDMGWDTVPEPATMSLLGLGAMFLIRRKRRA